LCLLLITPGCGLSTARIFSFSPCHVMWLLFLPAVVCCFLGLGHSHKYGDGWAIFPLFPRRTPPGLRALLRNTDDSTTMFLYRDGAGTLDSPDNLLAKPSSPPEERRVTSGHNSRTAFLLSLPPEFFEGSFLGSGSHYTRHFFIISLSSSGWSIFH